MLFLYIKCIVEQEQARGGLLLLAAAAAAAASPSRLAFSLQRPNSALDLCHLHLYLKTLELRVFVTTNLQQVYVLSPKKERTRKKLMHVSD